ncbi:hypothetical protein LBMAG42_09670 [Deltaproteobacteria bacterium]|nr:hypothetical protein LBMAG42_09670 [Deltaproteobacteria bacterium]
MLLSLLACAARYPQPLSSEAWPTPEAIYAWVGRGEASVQRDGAWVRDPAGDYDYVVVQRRYNGFWDVTKEMDYRHPNHRGKRHTSLYFHVVQRVSDANGKLEFSVDSALGAGRGTATEGFAHLDFELDANVPGFMPYSHFRFSQDFDYTAGTLHEIVELVDLPAETVFYRIEERAVMLATGG